MNDERCCGNCLYNEKTFENGKLIGHVCMNEMSENYGYITEYNDRCGDWDSDD